MIRVKGWSGPALRRALVNWPRFAVMEPGAVVGRTLGGRHQAFLKRPKASRPHGLAWEQIAGDFYGGMVSSFELAALGAYRRER